MRKAIEKIVIPKLQEAGFEGRYPHFRRNRGEVIDMIAFVPLKYGNGFNVGGTVVFPMEKPETVLSVRAAMLGRRERLPAERCIGRVLAEPCIGCPPAVPIRMCGERINEAAIAQFRYYGVESLTVAAE